LNFSNGQNLAGDRNFWPIFCLRPEDIYFSTQNFLYENSLEIQTSRDVYVKICEAKKAQKGIFDENSLVLAQFL